MSPSPIRVLIVDDSRLYRARLRQIIEAAEGMTLCAEASNGEEAIRLVHRHEPDFVVMDVIMPIMDGITAVKAILSERSIPILVFTAADGEDKDLLAFEALEAGALDVMPKPRNSSAQDFQALAEDLPERIRTLSRIQVLPSRTAPQRKVQPAPGAPPVFVVAASTGGPQAINTVLRLLPKDFPSPILVVQHISHGFLQGLVHWLERECKLRVGVATNGETALPGHIYFAPTQRHLEYRNGSLFLTDSAPVNGCKPAADVLFASAARAGGRVVAVVLTGMGADGLEGARALNRQNQVVLVQNPRSCAVAGMPSAVIEAGQATQVLDLDGIAREMCNLAPPTR